MIANASHGYSVRARFSAGGILLANCYMPREVDKFCLLVSRGRKAPEKEFPSCVISWGMIT